MSENTNNPTIKKTMVEALAFVTEHGRMSADNLAKFTADYCVAKSGSRGDGGPREVTILKDIDGNQLGRKCAISELWFDDSYFNKGASITKLVNAVKAKAYSESKVMENEAKALLDEAKDITDMAEKVAKYEEYDAKLVEAKAHRNVDVVITDEMREGGFETIEALAEDMGVEVNPVAPETEAETAEA